MAKRVSKYSYNPQGEELKILKFVTKRIGKMKEARKDWETRWDKDEQLFRGLIKSTNKERWQSKLFINRIFTVCMKLFSELLTNSIDKIVEPGNKESIMKASYMTAVCEDNWKKNKGNAEFMFSMLDTIKLGTSFQEIGYKEERRTIKEITNEKDFLKTGKLEYKEKEITEFDDVFFETVKVQDLYIDEGASSLATAKDCARRHIYDWDTFKEEFKDWDNIKYVNKGGDTQHYEFYKPYIGVKIEEDEVEGWRYFNKQKDLYQIIANGILLTEPDNPIPFHHKQLPFREKKILPFDKYTLYGISFPYLIEHLQYELNTLRNMGIDQTHLNIFSPFVYSGNVDVDEDMIRKIGPGEGISIEGAVKDNFQFIKQGQVGMDAYKNIDMLDDDIRQITGINLKQPSYKTATEAAIGKESILKIISIYLKWLEDAYFPEFAEIWGDTLQQYYFMSSNAVRKKGEKAELLRSIKISKAEDFPKEKVTVAGEFAFLDTTPEDIRGEFDFNLKIGTSIPISKEMNKISKTNLYQMTQGNPLIDEKKPITTLLKAHGEDPEDWLRPEQGQVDETKSIQLAVEQNKQIMQGIEPEIIPELITPKHIMVHQALKKSGKLDAGQSKDLMAHVLKEIEILKTKETTPELPESELPLAPTSPLSKQMVKTQGLPRIATVPGEASKKGMLPETMAL